MSNKTKHKQKKLKVNSTTRGLKSSQIIEVDEGLYNLVKELNNAGLITNYSCQGSKRGSGSGSGTAYITLDLSNVEEVSVRDFGKTLSIWWRR